MADLPLSETRRCRKCSVEFGIDEFRVKRARGQPYRVGVCRTCARDDAALQMRKWRASNPGKNAEFCRRRYERLKVEDRPKLRQERRASKTTRRAREKGANGSFNPSDIAKMVKAQRGRCYYCSEPTANLEVEHRIPLSRGGTNDPSNLVLACSPCNKRKMTKMPWELENPRLL